MNNANVFPKGQSGSPTSEEEMVRWPARWESPTKSA